MRSSTFIPVILPFSNFGGKRRPDRDGEPRNVALQGLRVTGFVGLMTLGLGAAPQMFGAALEPRQFGDDGNSASSGSGASQPRAGAGKSSPAPARPTATPVRRTPIQVFRSECLKCHDNDGSGALARDIFPNIPDFRESKWQDSRRDSDLSRSILEGKGKGMRPMKAVLGASEVKDLVSFTRGFRGGKQTVPDEPDPEGLLSVGSAERVAGPGPANSSRSDQPQVTLTSLKAQNGSRLFQQFCVKCHGADGSGKEMRARSTAIPNFTDPTWHPKRGDHQLAVSILEGKGTRMPGFRGRLGDKEAQDLVAYIRAMSPAAAARPAEASPTEFENRFHQLQRELDDLKNKSKKLDPGSGD